MQDEPKLQAEEKRRSSSARGAWQRAAEKVLDSNRLTGTLPTRDQRRRHTWDSGRRPGDQSHIAAAVKLNVRRNSCPASKSSSNARPPEANKSDAGASSAATGSSEAASGDVQPLFSERQTSEASPLVRGLVKAAERLSGEGAALGPSSADEVQFGAAAGWAEQAGAIGQSPAAAAPAVADEKGTSSVAGGGVRERRSSAAAYETLQLWREQNAADADDKQRSRRPQTQPNPNASPLFSDGSYSSMVRERAGTRLSADGGSSGSVATAKGKWLTTTSPQRVAQIYCLRDQLESINGVEGREACDPEALTEALTKAPAPASPPAKAAAGMLADRVIQRTSTQTSVPYRRREGAGWRNATRWRDDTVEGKGVVEVLSALVSTVQDLKDELGRIGQQVSAGR